MKEIFLLLLICLINHLETSDMTSENHKMDQHWIWTLPHLHFTSCASSAVLSLEKLVLRLFSFILSSNPQLTPLPPFSCLLLSSFLHSVQIPGNKMTAANLAVIFGPNLLQREGGGDVCPHAMGIEDSTAIINVTLVLIQNYRRLFTVQISWKHSSERVVARWCSAVSPHS